MHAIGDRGVREALDAFAGLGGSGADLRHHIAHLQLVHPDDVPRFAALGVAANMQALWACLDDQMTELTLPFLGEERGRWQYPFGDLHRAGRPAGAGQRLAGQHARPAGRDPHRGHPHGVRRAGRAGSEPFLPEQALDLATAFAAYTSGSAWMNHRDDAGVARRRVPSPTWSCSTATRSPGRPTRSEPPGSSRPGSTECRSSKPAGH